MIISVLGFVACLLLAWIAGAIVSLIASVYIAVSVMDKVEEMENR